MPTQFKPAQPKPKLGLFARIAHEYRTVTVPERLERNDPGGAEAYRLLAVTMRILSPKMTEKDVHEAFRNEARKIRLREARRRR